MNGASAKREILNLLTRKGASGKIMVISQIKRRTFSSQILILAIAVISFKKDLSRMRTLAKLQKREKTQTTVGLPHYRTQWYSSLAEKVGNHLLGKECENTR